jgi:hypothetical protein
LFHETTLQLCSSELFLPVGCNINIAICKLLRWSDPLSDPGHTTVRVRKLKKTKNKEKGEREYENGKKERGRKARRNISRRVTED